jgi:hypothetical protein
MKLLLAKLDKEINSYAYAATHHIIKTSKDLLKSEEEQHKQINNIFTKIIQMNPDKIHKRVLEIQDNLDSTPDENKIEMLNELLSMVSQIEQSLSEVKIDIESLNNENE